uniref:Cytochrome c oxidase subunit 3 n=1 Tax=Mytilus californianus TaxID=6549 RepID=G3BJW5_MYTCA|nr:cytochrome c oxidase subunit III [Mytilus californianus]
MVRNPFSRYYVPQPSPWPFLVSISINGSAVSLVLWLHRSPSILLSVLSVMGLVGGLSSWWRDLIREGDMGFHTRFVIKSFRDGVGLFIFSEVMFFFSFFWGFFHNALSPSCELGMRWPPPGIRTPNPMSTSLFETGLLISSGLFVTQAHKSLQMKDYDVGPFLGLVCTILCGSIFFSVQLREYYWNSFTISDSVYGSIFYLLTGFHGVHVVVGTLWLMVSLARLWRGDFSSRRHFGLEACIWYWHFVDVVWVALWCIVYVWFGGWLYMWWFKLWDGDVYSFKYENAKPSWYAYLQEERCPEWYKVPASLQVDYKYWFK